jgi:amicoumacin kinase
MNAKLIDHSAELYGISPVQLKPLPGGHSSQVYAFSRIGRDCVLRITPPNEELNLPSMQSIMDWMCFLSAHGAPVAGPLPSLRGNLVEAIEVDGQDYVVAAFERAKGILAEELPIDQWDETLFESLGRVVGRMHAIAKKYLPSSDLLKRPEWDKAENCYHCNEVLNDNLLIQEKREQARRVVYTLPKEPEACGLIHGDLHCANFFVDIEEHNITLFDFDDCCYGWFAMDIAMSVFDLLVLYPGPDRAGFVRRFLVSYLKGYLPENRLGVSWIGRLPLFLKLLEVEIYAMMQPFAPGETASWGDRFMAGRAKHIENNVPYVDVDFEEIYRQAMQ